MPPIMTYRTAPFYLRFFLLSSSGLHIKKVTAAQGRSYKLIGSANEQGQASHYAREATGTPVILPQPTLGARLLRAPPT